MANTKRNTGREDFWRAVLTRHAGSGLSVRAFCGREKLAESNFYAWRRTIAQRDRKTASSTARNTKTKRSKSGPAFVPVTVSNGTGHNAGIVLELSGGRRLLFGESIEPERLAAFVRALEAEALS